MTACHREVKTVSASESVAVSDKVVEAVTTAPTERLTERWHFSITPGVGRQLPAGQEPARSTPSAGSSPAGFSPSPGLGYVLDEYERVTEHLEPVAKTKTTENSQTKMAAADATERETDVGFSLKFYLLAGGALAAVVALGIFLCRSKLVRRLLGAP
jgi:hypothetical protein